MFWTHRNCAKFLEISSKILKVCFTVQISQHPRCFSQFQQKMYQTPRERSFQPLIFIQRLRLPTSPTPALKSPRRNLSDEAPETSTYGSIWEKSSRARVQQMGLFGYGEFWICLMCTYVYPLEKNISLYVFLLQLLQIQVVVEKTMCDSWFYQLVCITSAVLIYMFQEKRFSWSFKTSEDLGWNKCQLFGEATCSSVAIHPKSMFNSWEWTIGSDHSWGSVKTSFPPGLPNDLSRQISRFFREAAVRKVIGKPSDENLGARSVDVLRNEISITVQCCSFGIMISTKTWRTEPKWFQSIRPHLKKKYIPLWSFHDCST